MESTIKYTTIFAPYGTIYDPHSVRVFSGEEINKICDGKWRFVMSLRKDTTCSNCDIVCRSGLNISPDFTIDNSFDNKIAFYCQPVSLIGWQNYDWINRYCIQGHLIADVTIPDHAKVIANVCGTDYINATMLKSDIFELSNIQYWSDNYMLPNGSLDYSKFHRPRHSSYFYDTSNKNSYPDPWFEFVKEYTPQICLDAVRLNGNNIRHIKDQTPELCLEAVKTICCLDFIKDKTPEICAAALKVFPLNLEFIENQTPEICLETIMNHPYTLKCVRNQTYDLCIAAITKNPLTLQYVKNKTPDLCLAAINGMTTDRPDIMPLQFVDDQTPEICLVSVTKNPRSLVYVHNQTPEICLAAVSSYVHYAQYESPDLPILTYVKKQSYEICLAAVKQDPYSIEFVQHQTSDICLEAVSQDGKLLKFVHDKTPKICLAAVNENGSALKFVPNEYRTPELYLDAVSTHPNSLKYVKYEYRTPELCAIALRGSPYVKKWIPTN